MRFALLGKHPDGIALALAMAASGRHELLAVTAEDPRLRSASEAVRRVSDIEEILANPAIELVIVAGKDEVRPHQLRRALQSERHVLCVYPVSDGPEVAYEAAMIQEDVKRILLPTLIDQEHPAVGRLREIIARSLAGEDSPLGSFLLLDFERSTRESFSLSEPGKSLQKVAFPGWTVLRTLGGEIAELSAFAIDEESDGEEPVVVTGRFEKGALFRVTHLPGRQRPSCRITVTGTRGSAEVFWPAEWDGPAFLTWPGEDGKEREDYWQNWDPWPFVVEAFEATLAGRPAPISWQDAIRALELDDAARRSLARRRTSLLEYPEATEEVGFKGTMTLVGCGLLWVVILLLISAAWFPWLLWVIGPLLVAFLGLQVFRYALPKKAR